MIMEWVKQGKRRRPMNMKNENGSSLIEVIIAMVVLALLVTGLNACVVNIINSNLNSKEISSASTAGYELLDKLRRTDYSSIVTSSDIVRSRYLRSWTVSDNGVQKKISVVISWPLVNPKHSVELSTIIARP
jgi:Tfp pilus assembly protein PilV